MTRLAQGFWVVVALDAAPLGLALLLSLRDPAGHNDGGREMGLFFFIAVPAVVLALAALTVNCSPATRAGAEPLPFPPQPRSPS